MSKVFLILLLALPSFGASLQEQRLLPTEIYLRLSDGTSLTITKQQVQDFYQTTNGNAASRRAQVIQWIRDQISVTLGGAVDPLNVETDFDASFNLNLLRITH